MSLMTLTVYQLVWFYLNWRQVRRSGTEVLPLVRTIFGVIFCYALFDRVRWYRSDLPSSRLPAGLLTLGWIFVTIGDNVLERIEVNGSLVVMFFVSMIVGHTSVLFMLPVQSAIDTINRAEVPDHDPNEQFTVWNWLWMVFGALMSLAGIAATFAEP